MRTLNTLRMRPGTYLGDVDWLVEVGGKCHFLSQLPILVLELHILVELCAPEETRCHYEYSILFIISTKENKIIQI